MNKKERQKMSETRKKLEAIRTQIDEVLAELPKSPSAALDLKADLVSPVLVSSPATPKAAPKEAHVKTAPLPTKLSLLAEEVMVELGKLKNAGADVQDLTARIEGIQKATTFDEVAQHASAMNVEGLFDLNFDVARLSRLKAEIHGMAAEHRGPFGPGGGIAGDSDRPLDVTGVTGK